MLPDFAPANEVLLFRKKGPKTSNALSGRFNGMDARGRASDPKLREQKLRSVADKNKKCELFKQASCPLKQECDEGRIEVRKIVSRNDYDKIQPLEP